MKNTNLGANFLLKLPFDNFNFITKIMSNFWGTVSEDEFEINW